MYRQNLDKRDRGGAAIAVVAIHAMLLFAVLNASDRIDLADPQRVMDVFDIREVEPLPEAQPEPPPVVPEQREDPAEPEEGEPSPPNIRSEATPIVAPRPEFSLPVPVPMATTQTPAEGADATQGAADVPGPGTGAGGAGTGTGGGGTGTGTGAGGGGGGIAAGPSLIRGITNRDYPPEIQRRWPRGGQIFTRLWIEPNGRATRCDVMRSYGDSVADQWTCRLIMDRGQFHPARDAQGRPVASWYGYVQAETRRR